MIYIKRVSHAVFAATLIAIGVLGLIKGDFAPIWLGVPKGLPGREALAYLCTFVSLAGGIGLFLRRTAAPAVRVLFAYLLLWMLLVKVRVIVLNPAVELAYQDWGITAVIVAAAWVLYAWFATERDRQWFGFVAGDKGVRIARVLYALALITFGLSHFFYLNLTAPLVPGWLPAPVFWAYFTGGAFLTAGVAILISVYARLAATLAALQIGLFTFLIWVPMLASGHISARHWIQFVVGGVVAAAAWVVADSWHGTPWFAVGMSSPDDQRKGEPKEWSEL